MTEKHDSPNGFPPAHQERLERGRETGMPCFKGGVPSSSSSSKNTLIVGVGTLISRLLGFVRDAGIAWLLGGSGAADALTAALRIPYMARRLFGEGTLSLSLTAACTRERLRGGSGCGLALAVTRKLAVWTGLLVLACVAGAGTVMRAIAPGLEERPEVFGEAVTLFRICAPYIWSVMMAAGCMAALHSRQRFLLPSLTPSLFNLCVIGFALLAAFNPALQPGVLVACGVLCGGILQWLVQVPAIRILQREEGKGAADARAASETFRRLPAGIVGAAMPQLAFLGASALASLLPEGHMASLFYAERLLEFPLGVLGAAVGMAAAVGGTSRVGLAVALGLGIHKLALVADDFGHVALGAVLRVVGAGLQGADHADLPPLAEEAMHKISLLPPGNAVDEVRLAHALLVGKPAGNRDAEIANRNARAGGAVLGVADQVADENDFIHLAPSSFIPRCGSQGNA